MRDKNGQNSKLIVEKPRTKKVSKNPSEEEISWNHWRLYSAHFSCFQAATKTKPKQVQRTLRSLVEPIHGHQAEQSRVEYEMSRAEPRDKLRRVD